MKPEDPKKIAPSLGFLASILQAPFRMGAIAPTSRATAAKVVEVARVQTARHIVELGAGAGALTREIIAQSSPDAKILAVERDPDCAALLPTDAPSLSVVVGCASQLHTYAKEAGIQHAESIVCSLPWSLISSQNQETILNASHELLGGKGYFVTVICFGLHWLPSGRQFKARLNTIFAEVEEGPVIFRNCPPVFTYRCR